ncbi:helix-turn-helix transcriptional regulator [Actinomadura latina]|uniref:PadR family transcriptional regulator n=1 Tax=Actinomadura latina TaxID=163603 RepID=A0A846Z9G8_9ACTN|nr:helix-turn-helix transcriptional regulator [Actinomadura latina]NKZ07053.1 PadR family transcriptional regulator [Actinomadura latina]
MRSVVRLLQPCLLLLLSERPGHGYALIEHLRSFGLLLQDDPGAVYRALRELERRGLVEARWEPNPAGPARKVYSITGPGLAALTDWARDLEALRKLLDSYMSRYQSLASAWFGHSSSRGLWAP